MKIAILSDTHDLLRPEVLSLLSGCDCILHGGDISSQRILDRLEQIAPVKTVRGNNDDKEWAEYLPPFLDVEVGGLRVYMTHKKKDLPKDLSPYDLVIFGHSHQYSATRVDHPGGRHTLLLNPGSCGLRRFHQPITLAMLTIRDDGWQVERVEIPRAPREAAPKVDPHNIKQQIEIVMKETQKGNGVTCIAEKYGMDKALVEQIARLYVTHPGVTADGIMSKIGI